MPKTRKPKADPLAPFEIQWDTEKEAEFMKRMCYGGFGDARVVKVES